MKKVSLKIPQLMFVVATRAALGAGVGMLLSERIDKRPRRKIGWSLLGVGVATTVPAAWMLLRNKEHATP